MSTVKGIRKDQVLILAIVAVAILTFAAVVYVPQRRQLEYVSQQRREAAETLDRDKARAVELARIRGDVARMTEQLGFFNQRLPDQQELGQFLKDVSGHARSAGLDGASFEPKKVLQGELYLKMPIEMKFQGTFTELFRFLRKAKQMTRLTHIQLLSVKNDRDLTGRCNIGLVMAIYFTRG